MSAHLVSLRPVAELRDARRMAHRLIVTKPAAPGRLILSLWCLEIGAELTTRGELAPDCPFCRADVDAAAGKPPVSAPVHHELTATPAALVEALA